MFEYILFDLDGTLTDPKLGITSSVQYALRALGIEEPSLDKLEVFIGPPLTDSFREFYGLDEEQMITAVDKYRERFATQGIFENEIYPGIPQMLADLKAKGKKLAIASSKPTLFVEQILEHFEIRKTGQGGLRASTCQVRGHSLPAQMPASFHQISNLIVFSLLPPFRIHTPTIILPVQPILRRQLDGALIPIFLLEIRRKPRNLVSFCQSLANLIQFCSVL